MLPECAETGGTSAASVIIADQGRGFSRLTWIIVVYLPVLWRLLSFL